MPKGGSLPQFGVAFGCFLPSGFGGRVECSEGGCWIWTGQKNHSGYGYIVRGGKQKGAHRVAYEFYHGEIPAGLFVLHTCDVRNCVNPAHLYAGTHLENMADMVERGRQRGPETTKGESNGNSKLTSEEVAEIRAAKGSFSSRMLGAQYGVSHVQICRIWAGERW